MSSVNDSSGSPTIGGGISIPLGSGFDVQTDAANARMRLESLQDEAIAQFPAEGSMTKCNWGLNHIALGMDCLDFDGLAPGIGDKDALNATCMVRRARELCMSKPQEWREDSWERAVAHAMKGGLAFIGEEAQPGEAHGHVATVAPRPMQRSPSWMTDVPVVANVGKPPNAYKLLSACWRREAQPMLHCFLWRSGQL
jgi:hypothetical protein